MNFTFLERLFLYFIPESLLEGTPWLELWQENSKKRFIFINKITLSLAAVVYIFHYFFVDTPLGLTADPVWFKYRFSMAGIAVVSLALYFSPFFTKQALYRLPAIFTYGAFCYFQARTSVWYSEVPYVYALVFLLLANQVLQQNVFKSLVFSGIILALQWGSFIEAHVSPAMAMSACIVTIIFTIFARSNLYLEIVNFISQHERIDVQQKMIQANIEFTDRIKAFLPKVISKRLTDIMARNKLSVLQATDEVLRQRKRHVACLFSDIRGFTQGSKQMEYINQKVIPNVKECIEAIETCSGIPRKIGDLIFAYYDSPAHEENILNSLSSAFEMVEVTRRLNLSLSEGTQITRYILLSAGEAVVGNLGGFDSSVEITALGSPVNLLSRVDEITKNNRFQSSYDQSHVIISKEFYDLVSKIIPCLEIKKIDLTTMGVRLRDFEETDCLYAIQSTPANRDALFSFINQINALTGEIAA